MKWFTKTTYVDIDTGEIITKKHITQNLYIKHKSHVKKTVKSGSYVGIITILWECKKNDQLRLF